MMENATNTPLASPKISPQEYPTLAKHPVRGVGLAIIGSGINADKSDRLRKTQQLYVNQKGRSYPQNTRQNGVT